MSKRLIVDILFGVQIIVAFVTCGSQFFRFLETTEGQLLSVFLTMEVYNCLSLVLATNAHRARPSRVTRQIMWVHITWIALLGSNIVAIFLNGNYEWSQNDTGTTAIVLIGTVLVFAAMKFRGVGLKDPMLKGFLAMTFKVVPQFTMTFEVMQKSGAGIPVAAMLAGHISKLIRIGQIWFAIREAGWDRNRVWLFISELMNELGWITVTVAWMIWFLGT